MMGEREGRSGRLNVSWQMSMPLVQQILHVAKRQWELPIDHNHEADDLRR
jgi:hypothetical protein